MRTNTKVRILRKVICKISEEDREERSMSCNMDRSDDCGQMIDKYHDNILAGRLELVLEQMRITAEQYEEELNKIIEQEAKFCGNKPWNNVPAAFYDMLPIKLS